MDDFIFYAPDRFGRGRKSTVPLVNISLSRSSKYKPFILLSLNANLTKLLKMIPGTLYCAKVAYSRETNAIRITITKPDDSLNRLFWKGNKTARSTASMSMQGFSTWLNIKYEIPPESLLGKYDPVLIDENTIEITLRNAD